MASKEKVGQTVEFGGVRFGYLDPTTLKHSPYNYQTHTDTQRQALAESIEEFGWVGLPIFNKRSGLLVDGHARVEEARKRGEAGITCVIVDLTPAREKRLLLSYDRIGRLAGSDDHLLARLIRDCGNDLPPGWNADDAGDVLLRIADEDTQEQTPNARHRTSNTERRTPNTERRGHEQGEDVPVAGDVATVQLFFPGERAATFKQMAEFFKGDLGLSTVSDAVFEVLRDAYEGRG